MSDSTEQAKKPVTESAQENDASGKERKDLTDSHEAEREADAQQADNEGQAGG